MSAEKAQWKANQANIEMTNATNYTNQLIAEHNNQWNWSNLQAQNKWNIEQWERENAYNDPSAQMERYMKAGINPLWAISNGDPGKAQHLESGQPAPAQGATMVAPQVLPEWDPNRVGNIVSAAQNVSNSLQGFMKLGLESQDVDTRKFQAISQHGLNLADIGFRKAQTANQEIFNNLNTQTFGTLVGIKQQELQNLIETGSNTKADTANKQELNIQIRAMTNFTNTQNSAKLNEIAQGWRRLAIEQQNANANTMNAQTNQFSAYSDSYYRGKELQWQQQKFYDEFNYMATKDIVQFALDQRGAWEKMAGYTGGQDGNLNLELFDKLQAAGNVLVDRIQKDPTNPYLIKSYQEYLNACNGIPQAPPPTPQMFAPGSTILNQSTPWQQ